jgi:hypothetical protein
MAVGDPILSVGTTKTLEANGASITNASVVQADDANYTLSSDANNWPDAEFVLVCAFVTTSLIEGKQINLYARPLDVQSTNDTEVPEAGRPTHRVGSFTVNGVTTTQYIVLDGLFATDLPRSAAYYLHNETGQTVSSGWSLYVTPRNVIPATS